MEWATRGYQSGDERQVLNLLGTVWLRSPSPKYWTWLHRENPCGYAIVRVAECEDEIVSCFLMVPVVMMMGEEYTGYLGMHAVTHPHHRRKGMLKRLVEELIIELTGEGAPRGPKVGIFLIQQVGSLHTLAPLRAYVALARVYATGGVALGSFSRMRPRCMKDFFLILNLRKMLWRGDLGLLPKLGAVVLRTSHEAKMLQPPDQVEIEQISQFDESFDELWNAVSSSFGKRLVIKRSRAYLTWRYSLHPEYKYLTWVARENGILLGYVIARHDRTEDFHRGLIADIFGFDHRGDAMKALVSNVVRYFDEQGAELVRCRLSDGHPCTRILEDVGFIARRSEYLLCLGVRSPPGGVDQAWLIRKENHMITSGDAHVDIV